MTSDHFRDYLNSIARYPLLTPEQEIQLSRQVHRMLELESTPGNRTPREKRISIAISNIGPRHWRNCWQMISMRCQPTQTCANPWFFVC
jgi:DNA-directed RNA polymerase sigma subunit (sigma70/sigma32)